MRVITLQKGRSMVSKFMPQLRDDYINLLTSVERFWLWWSGELKQCVPAGVRHYLTPDKPGLTITLDGARALFSLGNDPEYSPDLVVDLDNIEGERGGERLESFLAGLSEDTPVSLFLSSDQVLSQEVMLPLAAEQNLDAVIRFELDRLMPFGAGEAACGFQLVERFPEVEKIRVNLVASEKGVIDALVNKIGALGLVVSGVYPELSEVNIRAHPTLNMLASAQRPDTGNWLDAKVRNTALVVAMLLVQAVAYPLWHANRTEVTLEEKIKVIQREASVLSEKRAILGARLGGQGHLLGRKSDMPGKLEVVKELTRLFPDHTWVSRLSLTGATVGVAGESNKASDLIERLDESPLFQNVRFDSPVTRNPRSNRDRYEIQMELVTRR
jgi:general secretion pathway protein L